MASTQSELWAAELAKLTRHVERAISHGDELCASAITDLVGDEMLECLDPVSLERLLFPVQEPVGVMFIKEVVAVSLERLLFIVQELVGVLFIKEVVVRDSEPRYWGISRHFGQEVSGNVVVVTLVVVVVEG